VLTVAGAATACVLVAAVGLTAVLRGRGGNDGPPPWSPPPALAAAGPLVSDDFSVPRDWTELRRDETEGATESFYDDGALRVRTTNPDYQPLGPALALNGALMQRVESGTDMRQSHTAVDARWHKGGVHGSATISCEAGGQRLLFRLRADGNWLILNTGFGGDSRSVASGRVQGLDPERLVRLEATCSFTPDLGSIQAVMLIDGERVGRSIVDADPDLSTFRVQAGVVGEGAGPADLSLDNFVLWGAF
jgi:hypothetical protein